MAPTQLTPLVPLCNDRRPHATVTMVEDAEGPVVYVEVVIPPGVVRAMLHHPTAMAHNLAQLTEGFYQALRASMEKLAYPRREGR